VKKFVKPNGRCPIDDWLGSKAITAKDQAALDTVVQAIESVSAGMFPPEKVKKYQTTTLYEVKARASGKQLRPFADKDDANKQIVLLCGAVEKDGKIDGGDITTGENLAKIWRSGNGSVKDYWEDPDDLETPDK